MVWDWLRRKVTGYRIPAYSAIQQIPSRGLPAALKEREADPAFTARGEAIRQSLLEPPQCPPTDEPLFVALIEGRKGGVLTMTPAIGRSCLLIFSTPFRALDYARTARSSWMRTGLMTVTPTQLVVMLEDLGRAGVEQFALDRCPRCDPFIAFAGASIATAQDAINCWSVLKSTELARMELYLHYAQAAARAGDIDEAYEVVLETLAHVSFDDPRAHLLLGQIAIALHHRPTLQEAKAFLRFFNLVAWERQLDEVVKSDSRTFGLTP